MISSIPTTIINANQNRVSMSSSRSHAGNAQIHNPGGRGRGRALPIARPNNASASISNRQFEQQAITNGMKLELLPSISRSGGDNGQGDSLKDELIQEQYWNMVQGKIEAHWDAFPSRSERTPSQIDKESNILLLLRKLREGVLASHRKDGFALQVYETSFYLAVIFESPVQASSSLAHLPDLYSSLQANPSFIKTIGGRLVALAVVSLIFHLSEAFPSQGTYYRQLKSFERIYASHNADRSALKWVSSVRAAINCRNYTKFEGLTRQSRLNSIFIDGLQCLSGAAYSGQRRLVRMGLYSGINTLRSKLRNATWAIFRVAYREFALDAESDTAPWLSRSLLLKSVGGGKGIDPEDWMEKSAKDGHLVKKDGFQGRWVLKR